MSEMMIFLPVMMRDRCEKRDKVPPYHVLSYRNPKMLTEKKQSIVVRGAGIEPAASTVSLWRSTTELTAHVEIIILFQRPFQVQAGGPLKIEVRDLYFRFFAGTRGFI